MIRYYIVVEGRVQGVGFRYTVCQLASQFALTGWVRNMDNGMVDMEIQGPMKEVSQFLSALRKPGYFIRVDDFNIKSIPPKPDENKFRVRN
jgi:acylphosphatase